MIEDKSLEKAREKLLSKDYPVQIEGLDESIVIINGLVTQMTKVLLQADDKLFIAERISFGLHMYFTALNKAFEETNDDEVKFYIATIFLANDNTSKVDFLLNFVQNSSNFELVLFGLMKLSSKKVVAAMPIIASWMEKVKNGSFEKRNDILLMLENAQAQFSQA